MLIKTSAPGKLILIGEYVVLEGAPALVCAVDKNAIVTIEKTDKNNSITASALSLNEVPFSIENKQVVFPIEIAKETVEKLVFFKNTFDYCLQNISKELPDQFLKINIDTESFYSEQLSAKLGFGSSAALTVALVKALFIVTGINLNDGNNLDKLFRFSLAAHKKAQENVGSGIDIAASSYGGVLKYQVTLNKEGDALLPEVIENWADLPMLTIFTGQSESTRKMVFGVNQLKQERPKTYEELMKELRATAKEGLEAYQNRNVYGFMNAVKTYHIQMNMLGMNSGMPIVSDVHQKIARIVHLNAGAYKPSGAGSGDIGIAFAESTEKINMIRKTIEAEGFQCIDVKIS